MKEKIIKMWREIKRGNFDYLFDAIAYRLPTRVFSYYHFYLVAADKLNVNAPDRPDLFRRLGTIDDLDMLVDLGQKPELVKKRFAADHRVVIAGKDNKILTLVWGSPGNDKYPGPEAYFAYGAFTMPSARGQGITSIVQDFLHRLYVTEGRKRIYGTIGALNTVSRRVHERMGYTEVGEGVYMIILGIVTVYLKSWPFKEGKIRFFLSRPPDNEKLWFLP